MDLDDELRRMFHGVDDRLDVPVRPDAERTIVAGARRIRRQRIAAVTASGAVAVAAVVAAGIVLARPTPEAMPPADVPTSTSSAPTSTTVTTSTTTPTSTTSVAPPAGTASDTAPPTAPAPPAPEMTGEPLGPTEFRALRIGMDFDSAVATGMVGEGEAPGEAGCAQYPLLVDGAEAGYVYLTRARGVEIIAPSVPVHTANGISIGWTLEQVKGRHPDFDIESATQHGRGYVTGEGYAASPIYRLGVQDNQVTEIALQLPDQTCYE